MTVVRDATRDDVESIARLHSQSWRKAYRGMLDDAYLDGPVFDDRLSVWTSRLTDPSDNQSVIVAQDRSNVVGFACVYACEDATWGHFLDNLHAHPERHSQGIGTALVAALVDRCRLAGGDHGLYLYVFAANSKARRFYEHLGASDVGFELRTPAVGGGEPREIHRYAWRTLDDVRVAAP